MGDVVVSLGSHHRRRGDTGWRVRRAIQATDAEVTRLEQEKNVSFISMALFSARKLDALRQQPCQSAMMGGKK